MAFLGRRFIIATFTACRFPARFSTMSRHFSSSFPVTCYVTSTRFPRAISSQFRRMTSTSIGSDAPEAGKQSNNIVTSECPDVKLVEDKSYPQFFFDNFKSGSFGSRCAIVDTFTGQKYSYHEIQELTIRVGSALTKLGFKKREVCAIYVSNIAEFPIILLGVLSISGIVATVNPAFTLPELCRQIKDTGAKYIITLPTSASNAKKAAKQCGIKEVIVVGEAEGCQPLSSLFQDDGSSFPTDVKINPKEDVAILLTSSGTTGLPKGVMLTHFNLICNLIQSLDGKDHLVCTPDDNVLGILPFFHLAGFFLLGVSMYSGSRLVSSPSFQKEHFLQVIETYKISLIFAVPPMVLFLAKSPLVYKYDLSSVRNVICGAAPLSKELELQASQRLKNLKYFRQVYGSTELSPLCHIVPLSKQKSGSVGTLLPNTEAKVVSLDTGKTLGPNEEGELLIRGPQVMKGYLDNPEATAETITSDGWLRTGDVGYYDSDNFFYIVDRCKELIKYKAYQVAPAELEAVLTSHPQIQDAAVIGIPDEMAGEVAKAFIVTSSDITVQEVTNYMETKLAPYKRLHGGIEFVNEIPKSASGKILRRILRDASKV